MLNEFNLNDLVVLDDNTKTATFKPIPYTEEEFNPLVAYSLQTLGMAVLVDNAHRQTADNQSALRQATLDLQKNSGTVFANAYRANMRGKDDDRPGVKLSKDDAYGIRGGARIFGGNKEVEPECLTPIQGPYALCQDRIYQIQDDIFNTLDKILLTKFPDAKETYGNYVLPNSNRSFAINAHTGITQEDIRELQKRKDAESGESINHLTVTKGGDAVLFTPHSDINLGTFLTYRNNRTQGLQVKIRHPEKKKASYYSVQLESNYIDNVDECGQVVIVSCGIGSERLTRGLVHAPKHRVIASPEHQLDLRWLMVSYVMPKDEMLSEMKITLTDEEVEHNKMAIKDDHIPLQKGDIVDNQISYETMVARAVGFYEDTSTNKNKQTAQIFEFYGMKISLSGDEVENNEKVVAGYRIPLEDGDIVDNKISTQTMISRAAGFFENTSSRNGDNQIAKFFQEEAAHCCKRLGYNKWLPLFKPAQRDDEGSVLAPELTLEKMLSK